MGTDSFVVAGPLPSIAESLGEHRWGGQLVTVFALATTYPVVLARRIVAAAGAALYTVRAPWPRRVIVTVTLLLTLVFAPAAGGARGHDPAAADRHRVASDAGPLVASLHALLDQQTSDVYGGPRIGRRDCA